MTRTASGYAERLRGDPGWAWNEIVVRLQSEGKTKGEFDRVHIAPESSGDIPDLEGSSGDCASALVVAQARFGVIGDGSVGASSDRVEGSAQRVHRNQMVFLIANQQVQARAMNRRAMRCGSGRRA